MLRIAVRSEVTDAEAEAIVLGSHHRPDALSAIIYTCRKSGRLEWRKTRIGLGRGHRRAIRIAVEMVKAGV